MTICIITPNFNSSTLQKAMSLFPISIWSLKPQILGGKLVNHYKAHKPEFSISSSFSGLRNTFVPGCGCW